MDTQSFSWKVALKHGGLAILFVVMLGTVAFALLYDEVVNPSKMGEGVGRFAAFSGMGALGVSAAWQSGRTKLAKALLAVWVLLVVATAGLVTYGLMTR